MTEPKAFLPEHGHLIQLGADVEEGWQGRHRTDSVWLDRVVCNREDNRTSYFETRPKPERLVHMAIPESLVRWAANTVWINQEGAALLQLFQEEAEKLD